MIIYTKENNKKYEYIIDIYNAINTTQESNKDHILYQSIYLNISNSFIQMAHRIKKVLTKIGVNMTNVLYNNLNNSNNELENANIEDTKQLECMEKNFIQHISIFAYLKKNLEENQDAKEEIEKYITNEIKTYAPEIKNYSDYIDVVLFFAGTKIYEKYQQTILNKNIVVANYNESENIPEYITTLENTINQKKIQIALQEEYQKNHIIYYNQQKYKVINVTKKFKNNKQFICRIITIDNNNKWFHEEKIKKIIYNPELLTKFFFKHNTKIEENKQQGISQSDFDKIKTEKFITYRSSDNKISILFDAKEENNIKNIYALNTIESNKKIKEDLYKKIQPFQNI